MGNWYCNNCSSYQDSWAEHQTYKKDEEYRRDIRCWGCDKHTLIYTDSQKETYKSLVKQRTSVPGTIHEVKRFATWWSNNLAMVISYYDSYYRVFLLVYVKENNTVEVFPTDPSCNYWGDKTRGKHNSLSDARDEAWNIGDDLWHHRNKYYHNPILLLHPYSDCSRSFDTFVSSPYVWKREIGSSFCFHIPLVITVGAYQAPTGLSDYFKVGDVIRVKKVNSIVNKTYFHVGVYLGNGKICHVCDPTGLISEENLKVRITDWDAFLNGCLGTPISGRAGELQRYRPIIPFKYYKKSIEQAVKAWYADFGSGKYDLYNDNCEHFANAIIFGTYYSQQIADNNIVENALGKVWDHIWTKNHNFFWKIFQPSHWGSIWRDAPLISLFNSKRYKVNNGKGKEINLRDEVNSWDSSGRFENLTSYKPSKIEECEEQYLIQVPPKQDCRIM
jgi:hypothetical protein